MEHLIFRANESYAAEAVHASRTPILETDWHTHTDLIDFVPPKIPWLGFNHDGQSSGSFDNYATTGGFDKSALWNGEFRASHADFRHIPNGEIGQRIAALFQAWFYFGFLESVTQKEIRVSYLTREDTDGQRYLYSRNLHFCLQARIFQIRRAS